MKNCFLFLPENFGNYFNWRAEKVICWHREGYEEHNKPEDVDDDGEGEEGLAKGTVEDGDIVDETINIKTVVIMLGKIAPETRLLKIKF